MNITSNSKGILFASFTAFLWGFLSIILKISLNDLSPVDVTWARFFIAFIILSLYYLFTERNNFKILIKPPLLLILAALCLGLNYLGYISGLNYTSPSIAQVFIQIGPVLLAISGFVIYKESAVKRQVMGLIIVILGLVIFYNEQFSVLIGEKKIYNLGVLWVILGAIAWAAYAIIQKKLVRLQNPIQLNLVLFGLPALIFMPFVKFIAFTSLNAGAWIILILLGLNTLFAYSSLAFALKYLEANKVSVIITLNPIITFIAMAILSGLQVSWISPERFTLVTIIGAVLVMLGAIMTILKKPQIE